MGETVGWRSDLVADADAVAAHRLAREEEGWEVPLLTGDLAQERDAYRDIQSCRSRKIIY